MFINFKREKHQNIPSFFVSIFQKKYKKLPIVFFVSIFQKCNIKNDLFCKNIIKREFFIESANISISKNFFKLHRRVNIQLVIVGWDLLHLAVIDFYTMWSSYTTINKLIHEFDLNGDEAISPEEFFNIIMTLYDKWVN